VLLQTSQGDVVIDLHAELAPKACKNFLKLCKCVAQRALRLTRALTRRGRCRLKYYNNCIFFNVQKDFIIQAGDPTNTGKGGDSLNKCAPPPRVCPRTPPAASAPRGLRLRLAPARTAPRV
jgi:peptidyl-prolyl cis-trans isomerase-like 4